MSESWDAELNSKPRNLWAGIVALLAFFVGQVLLWDLSAPFWLQMLYGLGFVGLAFGTARHHSYVFVFRFYVPIVVGLSLVWLYYWLHQQPEFTLSVAASKFRMGTLELLFSVLSTLYAICTAFLLWKGLTDHDSLRHTLRDEANQIQRVVGFLHYFDLGDGQNKQVADKMRHNFLIYVTNILLGDRIQSHEENYKILRDSIDEIKQIKLSDGNDKIALSEVMKGISDLVMVRSKRISQMETSMSPYLLSALVIMSAAILYPFFLGSPTNQSGDIIYVNVSSIFILGGLLSFLQMTLFDIGRPFDGFWKVKTDAFEKIRALLQSELQATEISQ